MIPIVYFRSSSFNCHRFCPMQYYMEYTLGWRGSSNKKADKGTIVHKALEICAVAKKGLGSMAIANCSGSQVINVCFGLALPWVILFFSYFLDALNN